MTKGHKLIKKKALSEIMVATAGLYVVIFFFSPSKFFIHARVNRFAFSLGTPVAPLDHLTPVLSGSTES